MRYIVAAALIATPAIAESPTPLPQRDCMEVIGSAVYGPETYATGVISGIVAGYVMALGLPEDQIENASKNIAAICRISPGMTFAEALETLRQDD